MATHSCDHSKTPKPTFARLPTAVRPIKYWIDYDVIDLMNFRFEASERVQLRVNEATDTITCHAIELCVFDVAVEVPGGSSEGDASTKKLPATKIQFVPDDESVTFHFAEPLPVDSTVTLSLRFHGFINDKQRGFFRTEYSVDNEKRVMASTQFEPCDARRVFVCWDEPAIKARFEVSMVTETNLTALFNTEVVETEIRPKKNAHLNKLTRKDEANEKYWKFAETPTMSTYIVALAVGEFDTVSATTDDGIVVTVYAQPGKADRGRFAADFAVKALAFFTQKFKIPYPLKKLDMVSVPDWPKAMENWGLIPYYEAILILDENTSHEVKVLAAQVIAHELAHQWFGNLVTMDWWTGLWLNEGFASYMQFAAVDAIFPEWKVWELFVKDTVNPALGRDAMVSSHPIEVEVHHPKEVMEIFDAISYEKGASVVRMLADFLGHDVFYQGVHNYLVKFSYQNTKTEDLWDALEQVSGLKITQMANTWTKQTGYPLVTVNRAADGRLTLTQERFFSDFDLKKDDATLWDVPLTLVTSEDAKTPTRIGIWDAKTAAAADNAITTPLAASDDVVTRLNAAVPSTSAWVKLNPNRSNFYIVNYSSDMWKKLQEPVKSRELGVIDRVSLVRSVFSLATAGVLSVADAFDFMCAYADEPEYQCWKEISGSLEKYLGLFEGESFNPLLKGLIRDLFSSSMKRLTWDPTDEDKRDSNTADFRATVIARLGGAGDEPTIQEARKRATRFLAGDKSALSPDLRRVVLQIFAKNTTVEDSRAVAKQLREFHDASDSPEEKMNIMAAIGHVPDVQVKRELLEWAFGPDGLKVPSIFPFLGSSTSGVTGLHAVWEFFTSNYDSIAKQLPTMGVGVAITIIVGRFRETSKADEIEAFFSTKDTSEYKRSIETALETVRLRSKQFNRDRDVLAKWLEQRQ